MLFRAKCRAESETKLIAKSIVRICAQALSAERVSTQAERREAVYNASRLSAVMFSRVKRQTAE